MKYPAKVIIFFLSMWFNGSYAQSPASQEKHIKDVYSVINKNIKTYHADSADLDGSGEGGFAVKFSKKNSIDLIAAVVYGETFKQREEYYYENNKLLFVVQFFYRYNRPFYYDKKAAKENNDSEWFDEKKTQRLIKRFYFAEGAIFKILDEQEKNKKFSPTEKKEFTKELLDREKQLKSAFLEIK